VAGHLAPLIQPAQFPKLATISEDDVDCHDGQLGSVTNAELLEALKSAPLKETPVDEGLLVITVELVENQALHIDALVDEQLKHGHMRRALEVDVETG